MTMIIGQAPFPNVIKWYKLDVLTYAAGTTDTTVALPAYDFYLLLINLSTSATNNLTLAINGGAGSGFWSCYIDNATVTHASAATGIISKIDTTSSNQHKHQGMVLIGGKTAPVANGTCAITCMCASVESTDTMIPLGCDWVGGNAVQITSLTVAASAGNVTGNIAVFGGNAS